MNGRTGKNDPAHKVCPGSAEGFRDVDAPWCPEMVVVPAGTFMMGSPEKEAGRHINEAPQHEVTIAKPFAIGRYAVTRGEFSAFVNETRHDMSGGAARGEDALT